MTGLGRTAARVALWLSLAATTSRGEANDDRVTVRPAGSAKPVTVLGEIVDFNGRQLRVRQRTSAGLKYFDASEVLNVETFHLEEHRQGVAAFTAGRIAEAQQKFAAAAGSEHREWVRREILSWLVRCHLRQEQWSAAIHRFLEIVDSDPHTRHWSLAPLAWSPLASGESLHAEAKSWLADERPAARLIGASYLLLEAVDGEAARIELSQLARETDNHVRPLATAQLWRLRRASSDLTENELAGWRDRIARMPETVRGGPWFLVGAAHFHRSEYDAAAAAFLWLPLVYSDNDPLAARACLEAAESLDRLGRRDEARAVFQETATRFGWSPLAEEARRKIAAPRAETAIP